ncbi:hypothetical protein ACFWU3_34495 [Streptomyces sp. NPDC058685]|uniref:hypothetical protein n=1 Tax=Streptomyces sp. NPDC058685 TaxID=3346598 RepID=UPI00365F15F5
MSSPYAFPDDLTALQLELDRVRAAYEEHCRSLPWSVEPMIGRNYERPVMGGRTQTITHPDSPGYTPEQIEADRQFRSKILELAAAVLAHDWWAEVPAGEKLAAQMALKHIGDKQPLAESAPSS